MVALAKGDYATAETISATLLTAVTTIDTNIQASADPTAGSKAGDSGDSAERTVT